MPEFHIPVQPDDLLEHNGDKYVVQLPLDVSTMAPEEIVDMLEEVGNTLQADPIGMVNHEVFDKVFAVANKFVSMDARVKNVAVTLLHTETASLLQLISQRLDTNQNGSSDNEDDEMDGHDDVHAKSNMRNAVKMFCYLIALVLDSQEKSAKAGKEIEAVAASVMIKKPRGAAAKKGTKKAAKGDDDEVQTSEFVWETCKESLTNSMVQVLEHNKVAQLWKMSAPEEEFGNMFFRAASTLLESEGNLKNSAIKSAVFKLLIYPTKRFQLYVRATTCILHTLMTYDHASVPIAELMQFFAVDHECPKIVGDLCREIGRLPSAELEQDRGGAKSISAFLIELSARLPRLVFQHLVLLMAHLDGESYNMRNGIVSMIGQLVCASSVQPDAADVAVDAFVLTNKQRGGLLSVLAERVHDVTAFTRGAALKTWLMLAENNAIPVRHFHSVVALGLDRLEDKSSIVRKAAIQLLSTLLQNNPFLGDLSSANFKAELQALEKDFQVLHRAEIDKELQDSERILAENSIEMLDDKKAAKAEERTDQSDSDVDEMEVDESKAEPATGESSKLLSASTEEIESQKRKYIYLHAAVRFIEQMELALPAISHLLGSNVSSDIEEAVEFLVQGASFRLPGVQTGVEQMLHLIWSKETSIKSCVVEAYGRLYLTGSPAAGNSMQARLQNALLIAIKLIGLTVGATLATLTSLEELISIWMSPGKLQSASNDGNSAEPASMIEDNVIDAMWSVFVAPVGTFSAAQRRGALLLIGFAANVKPAIISKNITHVIQHGLPSASVPIEQVDLPLSRAACLALQKLFLPSASASTVSASIPVDELSASLSRLILSDSCQAAWFGTVEQAVGTLFLMHENPEQIAVSLLQNATQNWLIKAGAATDKLAPTNLSKLFFLTGQVAIKMLVFIEQSESRVKGLRSLREKASETQAESAEATIVPSDDDDGDSSEDDAPRGKSKGKQTKAKAAKKPSKSKKASESASAPPADLQTDMGLAGTEEYELEVLREQAEHSLLAATSILGKLLPLTVQVLKSPSKFPSSSLQRSAVLCLSKCMTVHAEFCETYLPVLFTLLEKSTDASLRANIMIALGDMAFRFPNLIDPWTSKMYAPLREKQQPRVRKNTLMVLTHLILNDMIKVKGEISEMAVCIEDEDTRIADLAKLFFHELAKKGKNPVYNILSDTMSRLSSSPNVSPTLFQSVLRFLLQFIDKEKQTESLVEKLCQRLLAASDVKGMRDFAYCLSQLTFSSEKCVKKIMDIECLKCYKDRLFDQDVFSFFGSIARQMKKTVAKSGQELRDQVDEWEKNLESWHLEQAHDANTATRASNVARSGDGIESAAPSDAPIKILVPTVAPRRVRNARNTGAGESEVAPKATKKTEVTKKKTKSRKADSSDGENDDKNVQDDSEEEIVPAKSKVSSRRARRNDDE